MEVFPFDDLREHKKCDHLAYVAICIFRERIKNNKIMAPWKLKIVTSLKMLPLHQCSKQ